MRIHLTHELHSNLLRYLFHDDGSERAAFVYVEISSGERAAYARRLHLPSASDYARRDLRGLELGEHVRPELIHTAHQHGYGVIEAHAHDWPGLRTRFSRTDLRGLGELGPHMLWRLPLRPYTALVFGPDSFDALQWQPDGSVTVIDGLVVDGDIHRPTGRSLTDLEPSIGSQP